MDTKDTAETTEPSVAPAKLLPKPKPAAEPEREASLPSEPLPGLGDESLRSLGAALSELHLRTPQGKAKKKDTWEGGAEDDGESVHVLADNVFFGERLLESALGAIENPGASSIAATTLAATHYGSD